MQLIHGDADRAADGLIELAGVDRLGGSLAQREIVEDTLIHCAIESRRFELAGSLLDARLERRSSPRDSARRAELTDLSAEGESPHPPSLRSGGIATRVASELRSRDRRDPSR
jgi:hypothetical protein